jgi:ubiquinone/menaquinone biosynthesis C-methylase UbiE
LEIFRHALHLKKYFAKYVRRYLGKRVLEVGAGIGETVSYICTDSVSQWVCLEPDESFCRQIEVGMEEHRVPAVCSVVNGTLDVIDESSMFDTVLYMDVLEHIEQGLEELAKAMHVLRSGGKIIVLSLAHQFLFSKFDESIGHYRRYSLRSLAGLCPQGMAVKDAKYLDSAGMLASLANRLMLRQSMSGLKQILFWDRVIVPISRWIDPLFMFRLWESVLVVFEKKV